MAGILLPAHAQVASGTLSDPDQGPSIGLQALFQRDASGAGHSAPNLLFGGVLHLPHSPRFSTEWSASIGTLSGPSFKSRRIPLESRLRMALGRGSTRNTFASGLPTPFLYGGVGWLIHRPIEVPAPNDPLTGGMGPSLGSSTLWQFNGGVTPYLPVGAGASTALSREAWLDARIGYHIPLQVKALSSGAQVERGFWGFTLALRFRADRQPPKVSRPTRTGRTGSPFSTLSVPMPRVPQSLLPDEGLREEISATKLLFEINSSRLGDEQRTKLDRIADLLEEDPAAGVLVSGHTDPLGSDRVNEFLSWNRARAVWLYLLDRGISPDRLRYRGFRDQVRSSGDATLDAEFPPDRRVEFHATSSVDLTEAGSDLPGRPEEISPITGTAPGTPLAGVNELPFSYFSTQPNSGTLLRLAAVRDLLVQRPHYRLSIVAVDRSYDWKVYQHEVSKGRAEWVRAWLIQQGVDPSRLKAYGQAEISDLPESVQVRLQGTGQQMLLLPWLDDESEVWP